MLLKAFRFITLVLAALSLTMESAHVLEMPQKMTYDPQFYAAVNSTLYRYFAIIGAIYQIGAIIAADVLAYLVRKRRPSFQWTITGALLLLVAFGIWLWVVEPVNVQISDAIVMAPESVPALWTEMRDRWEYGHMGGFIVQLLGFAALTISVLVETPGDNRDY